MSILLIWGGEVEGESSASQGQMVASEQGAGVKFVDLRAIN
jgi:hypothetical protein